MSHDPVLSEPGRSARGFAVPFAPAPYRARSLLLRYGVALLSAAAAVFMRELLTPLWGHKLPFLTLYPAALVSTWYGGLGPGLVTTGLCAVAAAYLWLLPVYTFAISDVADQVGLALAVLVMLLITWLTAGLRRAHAAFAQHVREVERLNADLQHERANLQEESATRQCMEQHLHERVEELEALWELLPVAVWRSHDPACTLATGNRMAYELFRMAPGANAPLSALDRPTHYTVFRPNGTAVLPEDMPMQYAGAHGVTVPNTELVYCFADGSPAVHAYVVAKPLFDTQGQVRGSLGVFMDITARVQAEKALQAAHDKLTAHIENTPLAVIEWDSECRVQEWPAQAERLFGWTADEVRGQRLDEIGLLLDEDVAAVQAEIDYLRMQGPLGGVPHQVKTNRNRTKDGHILHCQWYNSMLFDEAGQLRSLLSLIHDVTASVEAQAVLRHRREDLERLVQERTAELTRANEALQMSALVLEHMAEGAVMVDADTNEIVFTNPAFDTMCGYGRGELVGQNGVVLNAYTPEENAGLLQALQEAARTSGVWTGEIANRKKDGTLFTSLVHGVVLERGEKKYWVSVQQDITARKQMEQELHRLNTELEQRVQERTAALHASEERYHLALRATHEAIWDWEVEQDCTIWSEALEAITGFPLATFSATPDSAARWRDRVHPEDAEALRQGLEAALAGTGDFWTMEYRFQHASGQWLTLLDRGYILRNDVGTPVRMVGSLSDITARKRTEEALAQHARDLAHAHADLRQVAYVSAHDLQEPIRQVGLYTQRLALRYGDALDADVQEAVAYIVEGTKRMQLQFTDLTHYLEVDEHAHVVTQTNCEDLLQQALTELRDAIRESDGVVTHDPLPTLAAHAKHLQLVFHELLDNALKFRGTAPPRVHVWAEREADGWRFAVRDNGIGLVPSATDQLFRFFRKFQRRTDYPGTGMGLAICKKIVDRHGGRIWVESIPNEGTTVLFTIQDRL
jgi:PAS domain S-box-containing protein